MPVSNGTNGSNGATSPRPKVLIPEKVSPDGLALLSASLEVHERKGLSPEQLLEIIPDYDALIVRSETKVNAQLLNAARRLKVVARAGVGVDNVDVETATKNGIVVVNSPSGNINAAAEHTIALGLTVARIAGGLGMHLIAYDPYANTSLAAAASVTLLPDLASLLTAADFFTIHTPLIASTKGMISAPELATMKPTARILNVARGGMIDESALLDALNAGTIAGAGLDVFTTEPPAQDSPAARLIAHPKVVATPHLGASTVEAQENVSIDVCEQVLSILSGQLPRSAVNAPLILPEEYRTLQPFVSLVEKMGSLYTQHFASGARPGGSGNFRTTFDLTYEGSLASLNTTKPLFAALVKGILAPISSLDGVNVNIVNAELVAKERGILINENRSREDVEEKGYTSFVTLRARTRRASSVPSAQERGTLNRQQSSVQERGTLVRQQSSTADVRLQQEDQVIQGFVSGNLPYISRLGRFSTNISPSGTLLICRNFDSCGRIGFVGSKLGKAGVNINFMTVAPVDAPAAEEGAEVERSSEALMILGVDRPVEDEVVRSLIGDEGVLEASVVTL
ncbi:hypothetical protein H2201_002537 [Coniosporium apollinis]|uniref:D-3-phosphoglycerate dehydrogenase n=1 Tax=Coniosporium apollinis TaxID=61459 RepID=A0ABQ9NY76_9PEZI|nr:hypothetical protein H2201_002537 [Coniosporium apollinis]